MIINMNGGSGGASGLNFKVICSETQPTSPSENTIWVESSTAAGTWSMIDSADLSSITSEGYVVISYEASNTSDRTFNALKKNELAIKLTKCYQRVSSKWVSMNAYIYTSGSWQKFSSVFKAYITVTYPAGSTCTVTNGSVQFTAPNTTGSYTFTVPSVGAWTVSCTNGTDSAASTISITADGQSKSVSLSYNTIPTFTYTGDYEVVNDAGEVISVSQGDWNIRLLTAGNLTFQDLKNASDGIDIFLVGGGGGGAGIGAYPYSNQGNWSGYYWYGNGGGGSGYTKTVKSIAASTNTAYAVTIGAGGAAGASGKNGSDGGTSSIVIGSTTYSIGGGKAADGRSGGNGGSGGGAGALSSETTSPYCGGAGGTDGGDGVTPTVPTYCQGSSIGSGGTGQGTTTRAFGDINGVLYATGGGGAGGYHSGSGAHGAAGAGGGNNPNTGDGGKGGGQNTTYAGYQTPTAGGSGVIIIRNHRTA